MKKVQKENFPIGAQEASLVDAVDRVIEKGAYIRGDVMLQVADVDLIFIGLRLIISSVSKEERWAKKSKSRSHDQEEIRKLQDQLSKIEKNIPRIIKADSPQKAEQGIAKLVLTLVELLRQLLEREAIRRIDQGSLNKQEIEKLGLTFQALEKKIEELRLVFGIEDKELNVDLGPLGKLL